jgi:hypothetical protein
VVTSAGSGSPNLLLYTGTGAPPPPAATVPAAPTNVVATAGKRSATVTWTQGADGGSALTGQTIWVYRGGTRVGSVAAAAAATSGKVTGLKPGTSYSFRVTATNAVGASLESQSSNEVVPTR